MAHNLFQAANGQYSMFSAIGKHGLPWHKLGQMVQDAQTWEQAIKLANLDWTVTKHQLTSPLDGSPIDAYGCFRDDTKQFLGSVGAVYTPIQNAKAFDFVDTLMEAEKGAHYESAGALGNGSRIWCLARVPYDINVGADKSECYLLFSTSHDGTESATCKLTTVRVVCQNTLSMALNGAGNATLRIRHSANGTQKLEAAKRLLTGVKQNVDGLTGKLNELAKRKPTPEQNKNVMAAMFGDDWQDSSRKKNQVADIARLFNRNDNDAFPEQRGTAYALLNAMTDYTDHQSGVRVTDARRGMSESQVRAEKALFNGGDSFKSKALETILELTEGAPRIEQPKVFASAGVDSILSMVNV